MYPDCLDCAANVMRRRVVGEAAENGDKRLIARFVVLCVCHAQCRFRCDAASVQELRIADVLVEPRLSLC